MKQSLYYSEMSHIQETYRLLKLFCSVVDFFLCMCHSEQTLALFLKVVLILKGFIAEFPPYVQFTETPPQVCLITSII